MAVEITTDFSGPYSTNGVTTVFPFTFISMSNAEIGVLLRNSEGVDTVASATLYNVTRDVDGTGSVTFTSAPASGSDLYVYSNVAFTQSIEFEDGSGWRASPVNEVSDRAAARDIWLKSRAVRSLSAPVGEALEALPSVSRRASKFLAFDESGNPMAAVGQVESVPVGAFGETLVANATSADAIADLGLSASGGSGLVGFLQAGTGAVDRTVQAKLRDKVSVKDFGAVGDGVANDTTAVQNAINAATAAGSVLKVPAGVYRLTSPIEVPAGAVIEGVSGLYRANSYTGRTVFHIDHTGRGFTCTGAAGGREFRHLATLRNQPTSFVSGWTPNANDWDFVTDGATDVSFDDILLINATKGIGHVNGGGRFTHNRVWGQPFQIGIEIEEALDVVRSTAIHFWPFWSATKTGFAFVEDWMMKNGTAYYSKRNDNPEIYGLFSILYRHCLRIGQKTTGNIGTTKRMRAFGVGSDVGGSGITLDSNANGAKVDVYGFYAQGAPNDTDAALINIEGTNSDIRIYGRCDLTEARTNAIRLVGSGSGMTVNDLIVSGYNVENGGHTAVRVDAAAFGLTVRGQTAISGGVEGAAAYGGGGRVNTVEPFAYTPTITTGTGTITSFFENTATFTVQDRRVTVEGKMIINVNGTGATDLRVSVPIPILTEGVGSAVRTGNIAGGVRTVSAFNAAVISRADGTYIGGNSAEIFYQFSYRIA